MLFAIVAARSSLRGSDRGGTSTSWRRFFTNTPGTTRYCPSPPPRFWIANFRRGRGPLDPRRAVQIEGDFNRLHLHVRTARCDSKLDSWAENTNGPRTGSHSLRFWAVVRFGLVLYRSPGAREGKPLALLVVRRQNFAKFLPPERKNGAKTRRRGKKTRGKTPKQTPRPPDYPKRRIISAQISSSAPATRKHFRRLREIFFPETIR